MLDPLWIPGQARDDGQMFIEIKKELVMPDPDPASSKNA